MPLVSFVVPVYNSERHLVKCLNSILNQSIGDFEVILIDDGSTDASAAICDKYVQMDKRFKVLHKINQGVSAARNDGIALAEGEWITFVDSDDWVQEDMLEVLINNPDKDYILTSYNKFYTPSEIYSEKYEVYSNDEFNEALFAAKNLILGFFTPWAKFFRAQIIKKNRLCFEQGISTGEDTIFVFNYLLHINSVFISDSLSYNWQVGNGLSNKSYQIDYIITVINHSVRSFSEVERRLGCKLSQIRYNSIKYLTDRINFGSASFIEIYRGLHNIMSHDWVRDLIADYDFVSKGKRRKLIDKLIMWRCVFLLSIYCRCFGCLYS